MAAINLQPIKRRIFSCTIKGTGFLVTHAWSEKAKKMMRDKQQGGKKTKTRDIRDPKQECEDAAYKTADGKYGVHAMSIKAAIVGAAHKDIGIEKTLVRKALFLRCDDPNQVLPIKFQGRKPIMREDMVRVGAGSADLRYRPQFNEWSCDVEFEIDEEMLQESDVATLIDRAGFGVGIGENRPEKGGEWGRFEIDRTKPFEVHRT